MPEENEKMIPPVERPPTIEIGNEALPETAPEQISRVPAGETIAETVSVAVPAVLPVEEPTALIDPTIRSIERILSEDMLEEFKAMSPADQERFKAKGEE